MKKTLSVIASATLLFLASCGGGSTPTYGLRFISSAGGASLYLTTTPEGDGNIKVVKLSGSFAEMGRQYGALLKTSLEEYFDDVVTEDLVGEKGIAYADLVTEGEASYAGALEETKEFMQGASESSGLTLEELKVMNVSMLAAIEGCSAVAAWGPHTGGNPLVVGRNWDMNTGSLDRIKDYMMVTVYNPPTGNSVADINYMGQFQLFQSAMNEKNLWIDMQNGTLSSGKTDDTLKDPNAAIFEFLRESSTMDELDAAFMSGPASASFIMTAADPNVAYSYFWCTQGTHRFDEEDE
ncbi:MAG TPA: C45 family autoproteolytic acyltransferase/hydrolase, partial [bacterium]|nr:C45 family autoproteolytic acyltransferase/hydrolase [bacterium]